MKGITSHKTLSVKIYFTELMTLFLLVTCWFLFLSGRSLRSAIKCRFFVPFSSTFAKLLKATLNFIMSESLSVFVFDFSVFLYLSAWNNSAPTGRTIVECYFGLLLNQLKKHFGLRSQEWHELKKKVGKFLTSRQIFLGRSKFQVKA